MIPCCQRHSALILFDAFDGIICYETCLTRVQKYFFLKKRKKIMHFIFAKNMKILFIIIYKSKNIIHISVINQLFNIDPIKIIQKVGRTHVTLSMTFHCVRHCPCQTLPPPPPLPSNARAWICFVFYTRRCDSYARGWLDAVCILVVYILCILVGMIIIPTGMICIPAGMMSNQIPAGTSCHSWMFCIPKDVMLSHWNLGHPFFICLWNFLI